MSKIYETAVRLRNFLYDAGIKEVKEVPAPVISVGNISSGGTGKTSLTIFLARALKGQAKVCILLRGYKRKKKGTLVVDKSLTPEDVGDEAYVLKKLLPDVEVVVSEDRYEGAMEAIRRGSNLIILDDGFQHRKLKRDIDIVLLSKRDLNDRLLPAGLLREPISSLKRADAIVLSYQDVEPFDFSFEGKKTFKMFRENWHLINCRMERVSLDVVKGKVIVAFAGLGNNLQFLKSLLRLGFRIKEFYSFLDHHHYRNLHLKKEEIYITTLKDMVKLPPFENVYALHFDVRVDGLTEYVKDNLCRKSRQKAPICDGGMNSVR